MGLFKGFKRQMLKVIQWQDNSNNTMVHKYILSDRDEIMNSSTLVVNPAQVAVFVHKGQICDIFAPGTYKLATENIPILTKILSLPTLGDSPIKADVYFVSTKQMTAQKWGTTNPIMLRDADFGNVRIRAFGVFSFRVKNAKVFMEQVFGTKNSFTTEEAYQQVKPMVMQCFADAVAESKISALDLAASYREFSDTIIKTSVKDFEQFGYELCSITIENISLPEEVEKALDERTKLGILGDKMGTYTQLKAANAIEEAAKNPNGNNFAGMGVGLGAGLGVGQVFSDALKNAKDEPKKTSAGASTTVCPKCNANVPSGSKFCPECGEKMPTKKFCPACGAKLEGTGKFCPECGAKL